ncbi:MAG: cbb3-type cytochrome c oxidase subunit I [Bacteroidetes bacterium]|nr:MAG: cbb3-type cytochrome c oxidase subunit I [Bacteroidota bacterium]REK05258.1 MAG: cbb3-type cytochrome c oxidase subunit I [Bacteroidota bacterium]REK32663.1 MAG: cbb3-type cytochrome c oxidase subunit I [Bacteroidota bacterium]REK48890.1 MAG: cbb3-type cytochrome c oxidase subunit I [Bacteroidota bacterium]
MRLITENKISLLTSVSVISALLFLLIGLLAGLASSLQYIFPDFLKSSLPFSHLRPIHTSLVISWIVMAACGGIYFYLREIKGNELKFQRFGWLQVIMFITANIIACCAYAFGYFGGREYLEFHPSIAIPLLVSWLAFGIFFVKNTAEVRKNPPVYIYMWITGIVFFILTLTESQLWLFRHFSGNPVRDVTVQWKALGMMVGSWNMLVYGTAFYLLVRISGDENSARSGKSFFFYFLGFINLLFNWGHHTYVVPASPWIKNIAYIISMTELIILFRIIWEWKQSLRESAKHLHLMSYRFIMAADVWIFINLILAIGISVPWVNSFTHGTHITVAHAMGATIGINCMILFASLIYIQEKVNSSVISGKRKSLNAGFFVSNFSLFVFWMALLAAGMQNIINRNEMHFGLLKSLLLPYYKVLFFSGAMLFIGLLFLILPLISLYIQRKYQISNNLSFSQL